MSDKTERDPWMEAMIENMDSNLRRKIAGLEDTKIGEQPAQPCGSCKWWSMDLDEFVLEMGQCSFPSKRMPALPENLLARDRTGINDGADCPCRQAKGEEGGCQCLSTIAVTSGRGGI